MDTQILLVIGPPMVSAVIGAWVALGRLYLARWGGPHLPRWIAPAVALMLLLAGMVALASQFITASIGPGTGVAATPVAQRTTAALLALMISPVWVLAASLAVLGIVAHYGLDRLLARLRLSPVLAEGLARGLRAVWAGLGLLVIGTGLYTTYTLTINQYGSTLQTVLTGAGSYRVVMSFVALGVALLGMLAPTLVARERRSQAAAPPGDAPQ
ncbi:MAG: hypothetical protein JXN59_15465 [Anaerolineae bacterium]|nr:hypothetical protein [Anaerolineae bacterium]